MWYFRGNKFSDREIQTLKFLLTGINGREIAFEMNISLNTVRVYCKELRYKLGIKDRKELLSIKVS